ncbi:hypothetical protein HanIR_Chr15g0749171 [Helianthus annuus]|nr:hypothetical protein HanIR_Chr15g0749171 [Helianthus annuus]
MFQLPCHHCLFHKYLPPENSEMICHLADQIPSCQTHLYAHYSCQCFGVKSYSRQCPHKVGTFQGVVTTSSHKNLMHKCLSLSYSTLCCLVLLEIIL